MENDNRQLTSLFWVPLLVVGGYLGYTYFFPPEFMDIEENITPDKDEIIIFPNPTNGVTGFRFQVSGDFGGRTAYDER